MVRKTQKVPSQTKIKNKLLEVGQREEAERTAVPEGQNPCGNPELEQLFVGLHQSGEEPIRLEEQIGS